MRRLVIGAAALLACVTTSPAIAHSASDAYLTLTTTTDGGAAVVHGQWDIAVRDLDFVLRIDANGDGDITWRELEAKLKAIVRYAFPRLVVRNGGRVCALSPGQQRVVDHADGAYVALSFDARCGPVPTKASSTTSVDYDLFFAIDPSHRAIVVWKVGESAATAVLSPGNKTIGVPDPR